MRAAIAACRIFFQQKVWARRYHGALLFLLLGIAIWGRIVSHPTMLVDLAGTWDACPLQDADRQGSCRWRPWSVPGRFEAEPGEAFGNFVLYRTSFNAPDICLEHSCKLVIAEVGDSASVTLNGTLIRQATPKFERPVYEKNFPVGVDLAPALLRPHSANDLLITVYSFRDQQVGLRGGPVGITTNSVGSSFLQWRSFRNVFLPLTCSVAGAVVVLLIGFLNRSGVSARVWKAFDRYAVCSAIFMFSFSEIPRQIAPLIYVVPIHFALRFLTDFSLLALLHVYFNMSTDGLWRLTSTAYQVSFAAFAVLLGAGTYANVTGSDVLQASATFSMVMVLYPLTTVGPVLTAVRAARRRRWDHAVWFLGVALAVLHDWAIGSGFMGGEFLTKYVHLVVLLAFVIALVRRTARAQAHEVASLRAEHELAQLARQVDHDIRSPLTALDIAARQLEATPENVRVLIRMAVGRIRDIANSLRQRQVSAHGAENNSSGQPEPLLFACLVDAVVSEKRMQFTEHVELEFDHQIDDEAYNVFVQGEPSALKRALSNLLNNAAEAMALRGCVIVVVKGDSTSASVHVADRGPGLPAEVVARLGERGVTFGKKGGTGLGIHHAMQTVQAGGGQLTFNTPLSGGTEAVVQLPRCPAPGWFANEVVLHDGQTVVIMDDDRAVHAAWRERFSAFRITLVHVSSKRQLERWRGEHGHRQATFFMDYELSNDEGNGLDALVELGLQGSSFLVTSHFENRAVLAKCLETGVKVIPKSLVDVIPVRMTTRLSVA